eukprot:760444-Hanusia_phi.AAC.15
MLLKCGLHVSRIARISNIPTYLQDVAKSFSMTSFPHIRIMSRAFCKNSWKISGMIQRSFITTKTSSRIKTTLHSGWCCSVLHI